MNESVRNIAVIAHVDHGKTTLVDRLLMTAGVLGSLPEDETLVMDSFDLERPRGRASFTIEEVRYEDP